MRGSCCRSRRLRRRDFSGYSRRRRPPSDRNGPPEALAGRAFRPGGRAAGRRRGRCRSGNRTAANRELRQKIHSCGGTGSTGRPAPRRESPAWRRSPRRAWRGFSTARPPHARSRPTPPQRSSRPHGPPRRPCRSKSRASWSARSSVPSKGGRPWPRPPSAANTPQATPRRKVRPPISSIRS